MSSHTDEITSLRRKTASLITSLQQARKKRVRDPLVELRPICEQDDNNALDVREHLGRDSTTRNNSRGVGSGKRGEVVGKESGTLVLPRSLSTTKVHPPTTHNHPPATKLSHPASSIRFSPSLPTPKRPTTSSTRHKPTPTTSSSIHQSLAQSSRTAHTLLSTADDTYLNIIDLFRRSDPDCYFADPPKRVRAYDWHTLHDADPPVDDHTLDAGVRVDAGGGTEAGVYTTGVFRVDKRLHPHPVDIPYIHLPGLDPCVPADGAPDAAPVKVSLPRRYVPPDAFASQHIYTPHTFATLPSGDSIDIRDHLLKGGNHYLWVLRQRRIRPDRAHVLDAAIRRSMRSPETAQAVMP
ncbi:uncharacterized protein EV422DRAFT_33678 [Fimicolochytrium jonesii]|uniref:uncharacterized protein n=1 Tax=Fimicolochytrium jonesii TaxID=1396493 RepID=UPI0022FE4405|nr:uncharacterized protein EV422DRAFT_33678 [Fimicolochytrium jonesii]KAI8827257.1 hypothetical protein EV422DRAFT_33678 [Fimicolochytrium jonesii]